jgi:hypothetical protein
MKLHHRFNRRFNSSSFTAGGAQSGGRLLKKLRQIKEAVQQEFAASLEGYESVLDLALNEAEALAWQTAYPHLLFPTLAQEKASELRRWAYRQRTIRRSGPSLAFAA